MKTISTIDEYKKAVAQSVEQPVLILKHSNACPISSGAYERIQMSLESGELSASVYVVVVQDARDLSRHIAQDLDIQHESPQVIVLKNGTPVFHTSHHDITVETLTPYTG